MFRGPLGVIEMSLAYVIIVAGCMSIGEEASKQPGWVSAEKWHEAAKACHGSNGGVSEVQADPGDRYNCKNKLKGKIAKREVKK